MSDNAHASPQKNIDPAKTAAHTDSEPQSTPLTHNTPQQTSATGSPPFIPRKTAQVLLLQRTIGNRAVNNMLQRPKAPAPLPSIIPAATDLKPIQRDYVMQSSGGGVYESETFGGNGSNRERPTFVGLPVSATSTPDRGAAPPPLSQYTDGGKTDVAASRKAGFDGGHIVGLHIGGEDISENVVPMYKAFNRGVYKKMEDTVKKKAVEIQKAGKKPWVNITCEYEDAMSDTPFGFTVMVESADKDDNRTVEYMQILTQPDDIELVAPLKEDEQKIVRGEVDADDTRSKAGQNLNASEQFFDLGESKTVEAYINTHKHLPPTKNGMYPDYVNLRPYEFLDMLALANKIDTGTDMSAFRDFTARQRELILQANMARNGGVLKSDDPEDTVNGGVLSEQGDLNFPEIDHMVPKSKGGSNFFSNARVVSWQLNNKDDRVKSLVGVIDISKRALPPLQGMTVKDMPVLVEQYLARNDIPTPFDEKNVWIWGTKTFPVMSGVNATPRRLTLVKQAILKYVTGGILVQDGSKYKKKT